MSLIHLPDQRQAAICARLARDGRVLAADLAHEFATSEDTIRRDLRELAGAGLCRRVYGGALPVSPASGSFRDRAAADPERKAALGRAAAALVRPHQFVFIDAGSTNLAIARELPEAHGLTVATNSVSIAGVLEAKAGIDLILLGGWFDRRSGGVVGSRAVRDARLLRPDLYFLGACALDPDAGLSVFDAEEAELKRVLVDRSTAVAVAAQDDKIGTAAPHMVAAWAAIDHLVVETAEAARQCRMETDRGPRLHVAVRP